MPVFRIVLLLLLVASAISFVVYAATSERRYRTIGLRLLVGTIGAGLVFFAVLIAENLFYSR
jgi:hypothetical protein